jgi:hypothetical protein
MVAVPQHHIFIRQEAYVDAILCVIQARLRTIVDAGGRPESLVIRAREEDESELHQVARASADAGVDMPLLWLGDRLGLSASEQRVLFLLLAHELDPTSRQLIRQLNTEQVSDPTLDAIRRAAYGMQSQVRAGVELGPDSALRRMQLIERTDGNDRCPEHRQTFALSRRVLSLAQAESKIDSSLADIASIGEPQPTSDLVVASATIESVVKAFASSLILVKGRVGSGRRSLLSAVARSQGYEVLQVDCRAIAVARDVAQRQLRVIAREARLLERVPLLCHLEALAPVGDSPDRIDLVEKELSGIVLATTSRAIARRWRQTPTIIEMPKPSGADLAALWNRAIPEASEGDAELMATMYPLAPALIIAAGKVAHHQAADDELTAEHVAIGVRAVLDDRLVGFATRLEVTQSWNDLVLPDDQTTALIELVARIRQRTTVYEQWGFAKKVGKGLGVAALFSGPPGTGKTMAACLVAKVVGLEVFQVDMSKIASKWIGETEKNLASLFDAAEACQAILLFDEADALFGKRTDVKSSNDRHANQEVNYLLQRMESFTGICFLTTNHDTAIDEAFRRRLSLHVHFPVPDVDERKALWRAMLSTDAPVDSDCNLDALANDFEMSGGYIRNAVLRAAFLAADSTGRIDGALLTRAAQLECESMGRVVFRG